MQNGSPPTSNGRPRPSTEQPAQSTATANVSVKMQSPGGPSVPRQQDDTQFGQPSPLRNPLLGGNGALYNPLRGPPRKKPVSRFGDAVARSAQSSSQAPSRPAASAQISAALHGLDDWEDPAFQSALTDLQVGMRRAQQTIISMPTNAKHIDTRPLPQPMFSSRTQKSVKPHISKAPKPVVIADDDDEEDNFDTDAALVAAKVGFGAPDPMMYVDSDRANENIKHLMEGAFDDASDKPTLPLKRRQRPKAVEKQPNTLMDKLSALSIAPGDEPATTEENETVDDGSVEGLAVRLLPHQVEGVSWMIEKESGKKKNGVIPRGGILADDMGLGKTVQSVALMLLNPRPAFDAPKEHSKQKLPGQEVGKSTLIVAPLALIRQWESEINTKITKEHALKVLVHHGSLRTKLAARLQTYDVVITTYQCLTSEHAASDMSKDDGSRTGCFGVYWYRIILDEAHSIKNRNAKSTLACCALRSWNRWCLTGTPMQNNLDELQSLIRFLRVKPYHELSAWKQQIIQPMKSGRGGLAMARLHHFLKAIMKRRTKDILKQDGALRFGGVAGASGDAQELRIVKREIVNVDCTFSAAEQEFYHRLDDRAQKRLVDMMHEGGKTDYIGALVLLLRLRQACNHPDLISMAASKSGLDIQDIVAPTPRSKKVVEAEVDELADMFGSVTVSNRVCDICGASLASTGDNQSQGICHDCEQDMSRISDRVEEEHSHSRSNRRVLVDSDDDDSEEDEAVQAMPKTPTRKRDASRNSSTKIDQILSILEAESPTHKTIIFSQFTSMLDLIQPHIEQRYVRYDGSMRPDDREAALHSLRSNAKTRVLLCSLKCGSLGLNLTAASRVIIVEPFWNPFVEEQAIDRVHRLNQTVDVKVYRLTVPGTVEERIVALQEKKRELANAAIEGGKAVGKLSMEDIMGLFRGDAHHSAEIRRADEAFAAKFGGDQRLFDGPASSPKKTDKVDQGAGEQRRGTAGKGTVSKEHQVYGRRW